MDTTSILNTSSIPDPEDVVKKLDCGVHPMDPVCVIEKVVLGITLLFILIGIVGNCLLIKKYLTTKNLIILFPCLVVCLPSSDILYLIFTGVTEVGYLAGLKSRTHLTFYVIMACLSQFAFIGIGLQF